MKDNMNPWTLWISSAILASVVMTDIHRGVFTGLTFLFGFLSFLCALVARVAWFMEERNAKSD